MGQGGRPTTRNRQWGGVCTGQPCGCDAALQLRSRVRDRARIIEMIFSWGCHMGGWWCARQTLQEKSRQSDWSGSVRLCCCVDLEQTRALCGGTSRAPYVTCMPVLLNHYHGVYRHISTMGKPKWEGKKKHSGGHDNKKTKRFVCAVGTGGCRRSDRQLAPFAVCLM